MGVWGVALFGSKGGRVAKQSFKKWIFELGVFFQYGNVMISPKTLLN